MTNLPWVIERAVRDGLRVTVTFMTTHANGEVERRTQTYDLEFDPAKTDKKEYTKFMKQVKENSQVYLERLNHDVELEDVTELVK